MIGKGCGCQTGILKYIPVPEASYFYIPCCIHDDNYDSGMMTRKEADLELLAMSLQIIERDTTLTKPRKAWLKLCAAGYYIAVRCFGWMYYNQINSKI